MGLYIGNTRYCPVIGKVDSLPYDAEIEYLESTGTQFVDTGISYTTNDVVYIYMGGSFTSLNGTNQLMGVYGGAYFGVSDSNNFCAGGILNTVTSADTNNKIFSFVATIGNSKSVTLNVSTTTKTFTRNNSTGTACLFNLSDGSFPCKFKLKFAIIGKNNTKLLDLIPVRVGQTGYLYDLVNGTLFGNAGTGSFVLGNDIT